MQEIVEHHGQNCCIQTSRIRFINCNKYFTDKDYTGKFQDFVRKEKY